MAAVAVLAGACTVSVTGATSALALPHADPTEAALSVKKTADVTGFARPGQTIAYTFAVTNTGSVGLHGITVTDSELGAVSGCAATLAPAASTTCTATHVTTAADVNAGNILDVVTVSGTGPTGEPASASALLIIPAVHQAAISITKTAGVTSFAAAGQHIPYAYTVTNTGNVTLHDVTVTDPRVPSLACGPFTLTSGGARTCGGTYTATAADVAAGKLVDTATATGLSPAGLRLSASAAVIIPLTRLPEVPVTG